MTDGNFGTPNTGVERRLALIQAEQAHMKKMIEQMQKAITKLLYPPRPRSVTTSEQYALGRHIDNVKSPGGPDEQSRKSTD